MLYWYVIQKNNILKNLNKIMQYAQKIGVKFIYHFNLICGKIL